MIKKLQKNLFLFSVNNRTLYSNFVKSVQNPVSINKIQKLSNFAKVKSKSPFSIWGINPTTENEEIWNEIKPNDVALFYRNGKYFAKSTILGKIRDQTIPSLLWGGDLYGRFMNLLIILTKTDLVNIDFESTIPVFVAPTMPQAYIFPIKKVDDDRINSLVNKFGSIENALLYLSNAEKQSDSLMNDVGTLKIPEKIRFELKSKISKQREGQNRFRNIVLTNFSNTCAVCGIKDKNLLEASHIIPVAKQDLAGSIENGICFCVLHHVMFDKGYFSFDDDFKVIISAKKEIDKHLSIILEGKSMKVPKRLPSMELILLHRSKFGINNS